MPENESQLKVLLETAGYYQEFVPNYADIASPLHSATQKGNVLDGQLNMKKPF